MKMKTMMKVMMMMMPTVITAMNWSMGIAKIKQNGVGRLLEEVEAKGLQQHRRSVAGAVLLPLTKVPDHRKLELAKEEGLVSHKLYSYRLIRKFCSLNVENLFTLSPIGFCI